jgi:hypothetical protein
LRCVQSADLASMQARAEIVLREDITEDRFYIIDIACLRYPRCRSAGSEVIAAEVRSAQAKWRSDLFEAPGIWVKITDRSAYMGVSQVDVGAGLSRKVARWIA